MTIRIECHACEKKLKVKDESAGRRVKCPGCGQVINVPRDTDSGGVQSKDARPIANKGSHAASTPEAATKSMQVRWTFYAGGSMALAAVAAVLTFIFTRPDGSSQITNSENTPPPSERVLLSSADNAANARLIKPAAFNIAAISENESHSIPAVPSNPTGVADAPRQSGDGADSSSTSNSEHADSDATNAPEATSAPEKSQTNKSASRELFSFSPFLREEDKKKAQGMQTALTTGNEGALTIYGTAFSLTTDEIPVPASKCVSFHSSGAGSYATLSACINGKRVWEHRIVSCDFIDSPSFRLADHGVIGQTFSVEFSVESPTSTGGVQFLEIREASPEIKSETASQLTVHGPGLVGTGN